MRCCKSRCVCSSRGAASIDCTDAACGTRFDVALAVIVVAGARRVVGVAGNARRTAFAALFVIVAGIAAIDAGDVADTDEEEDADDDDDVVDICRLSSRFSAVSVAHLSTNA